MLEKRNILIAGAILAAVLLCIFGSAAAINLMLRPIDAAAAGQTVHLDIEPGATTGQISAALSDKGLIRSALAFQIYARRHRLDKEFKAGPYELSPSMSLAEIAAKIASGEVDRQTNWFTIPEGYTVAQIAARLDEAGLAEKDRFLEIAARPPQSLRRHFPFIEKIDGSTPSRRAGEGWSRSHPPLPLEGYLFPDTYEIAAGAGEMAIFEMMLQRMEAVFDGELKKQGEARGLSMHQVLTLASIIEKEAGVPRDRALIAGVLHNRLERGWKLGSCPTVNYLLDTDKEVLSKRDIAAPSPYNTYLHDGLPPGPIAAPGEEAIRAALDPPKTDYLWFNTKGDGTGESFFSRTPREHEQNTARMMENIKKREQDH